MDICNLVVTGSITCGQGLFSEGGLYVGGRVSAPLVTLTFNQGFAKILGGVKARVLIECDHGGSRIFGPVDAATVTYDELVTDDPDRENASMTDVAKQLNAKAAAAIADLEGLDAATKLVELVAEGEPIF